MLADLLRRYRNKLSLAVGAFNWGPANVDRHGLKRAPAETRRHIDKVAAQRAACMRGERG
jgi:hypothetical protein